jgi:hypothetical protein
MASPQPRNPRSTPAGPADARRPLALKASRFARAARDPQWTATESAQARARLARQAAVTRQELLARRAAAAGKASAGAASAKPNPKRTRSRRGRWAAWLLTPLTVLLVLALLGSAPPVSSQTRNPRKTPSKQSVEDMQRLIEVAKEAGLTDEQIRQITLEDEFGNIINAWEYLQGIEKRQQAELARRQEEQSRVYLTPLDVFKELRARERADLDSLRENLPFDRERYR